MSNFCGGAVLSDITCDSHGKIDQFVLNDGVGNALPVHELRASEVGGDDGGVLGAGQNWFFSSEMLYFVVTEQWDDKNSASAVGYVNIIHNGIRNTVSIND